MSLVKFQRRYSNVFMSGEKKDRILRSRPINFANWTWYNGGLLCRGKLGISQPATLHIHVNLLQKSQITIKSQIFKVVVPGLLHFFEIGWRQACNLLKLI